MPQPRRTELTVRRERALLLGVQQLREKPVVDPLDELEALAKTANAVVVGRVHQRIREVNPGTYIGSGKAEQVRSDARLCDADVVICDVDLSPAQLRTLEEIIECKVIDRSELILDIFATHARSKQAKLQVELAQLEYTFPRLRRMWTHLTKHEGGVGTRGPGEAQIESDRRLARRRMTDLRRELKTIDERKQREVISRASQFQTSIVGYTNAGKSTLMNALTDAGVLVEDALFATLDTRTRKWNLEAGPDVLLSDTVGFIRNLPHHLVESFKATLEEATHADLLLHVVDVSRPDAIEQSDAVMGVLAEIGCADRRVLTVFNKMDAMTDPAALHVLSARFPNNVLVSALRGTGLDELSAAVARERERELVHLLVTLSSGDGKLAALIFENGSVFERRDEDDRTLLRAKLHRRWASWLVEQEGVTLEPVDG